MVDAVEKALQYFEDVNYNALLKGGRKPNSQCHHHKEMDSYVPEELSQEDYLGEPHVVLEEYSMPSPTVSEVLRTRIYHDASVRDLREDPWVNLRFLVYEMA